MDLTDPHKIKNALKSVNPGNFKIANLNKSCNLYKKYSFHDIDQKYEFLLLFQILINLKKSQYLANQ